MKKDIYLNLSNVKRPIKITMFCKEGDDENELVIEAARMIQAELQFIIDHSLILDRVNKDNDLFKTIDKKEFKIGKFRFLRHAYPNTWKKYLLPKRITIEGNPIIYRWLYWHIYK